MTVYKMTAQKNAAEYVIKYLHTHWDVLNTHKTRLEDESLDCWTTDDGNERDILLLPLKRELNADKNQLSSYKTTYGEWFAVRHGGLYFEQLGGLITSLGNIVTHINTLISTSYWDSSAGKAHVSEVSQAHRDQLASDIGDELSSDQIPVIPVQDVTASGGILITGDYMKVRGSGGAVTVTATPSVEEASIEGHTVILQGASNTNTLTLQDESSLSGSKLELDGGSNVTLGMGDILVLVYNENSNKYYEVSRSNI